MASGAAPPLLQGQLEEVREAERARIAREIHDELGQGLLVLRMDLVRMQGGLGEADGELGERLADGLKRLDASLNSVRMIINDLRPAVLDLDVVAASDWQLQQFRKRTGLRCRLVVSGGHWEIDQRRKTVLFRILQESLTNIARHAHARNVTVALARTGRQLVMTVLDDGVGLAPGALCGPQHGIRGMQERVAILGGRLQIANVATGGVVISVSLPSHRERRWRAIGRRMQDQGGGAAPAAAGGGPRG
jgi:signal transduction histidine kinase